jgi:hypothetical protein
MTACQTCPKSQGNIELEDIKEELGQYLDPGYFPALLDISNFSGANKKNILEYLLEVYSEHLQLLLSAKVTGSFNDDIDFEIEDCRSAIEWMESLTKDTN